MDAFVTLVCRGASLARTFGACQENECRSPQMLLSPNCELFCVWYAQRWFALQAPYAGLISQCVAIVCSVLGPEKFARIHPLRTGSNNVFRFATSSVIVSPPEADLVRIHRLHPLSLDQVFCAE